MKKLIAIILIILCNIVIFSACSTKSHSKHYYSWVITEEGHFKEFQCGCPSPDIFELHLDSDHNGKCDVCGYQIQPNSNDSSNSSDGDNSSNNSGNTDTSVDDSTTSGGGNSGNDNTGDNPPSTSYIYTDFTSAEKALFTQYIGEVIPFVPNNEYYVEGYYEESDYEHGMSFYTFGNTEEDFFEYMQTFDGYTIDSTYEDDYGDTWHRLIKDDIVVDMSFYYYEGEYVIDLYVYSTILSTEPDDTTGGNSGSSSGDDSSDSGNTSGGSSDSGNTGGGSSDSGNTGGVEGADSVDLLTNDGKGLPTSANGVYNVDFTKAEQVKNVTDQGYYLGGCPTTGSPAVLVIPVEFSDCTAQSKGYSIQKIASAFEKDGNCDYYSVYDYYNISSYGKLQLDITILDYWFKPKNTSSYYANSTMDYYGSEVLAGDQMILDEALQQLSKSMDLSKFDSDNNGTIDAVILINTLDVGEENFYWAYRYWNLYTDDQGYYYEYDGVSANDYLWASYQFLHESYNDEGKVIYTDTSVTNPYTFIHEFGHVLGADDYYDTAYVSHPLDGHDIMDSMTGDHNPYTKFNFGWLTSSRLVVTNSSVTLSLESFAKNGDTIILANDWDEKLGAYQEYYAIVYYTSKDLNGGDYGYFNCEGIIVYHINASLYKEVLNGETYYDVYNNNTDPSDQEYGTENNLIEFVKSSSGDYTYTVGDSLLSNLKDDSGEALGYTFTVDSLSTDTATITFTKVK